MASASSNSVAQAQHVPAASTVSTLSKLGKYGSKMNTLLGRISRRIGNIKSDDLNQCGDVILYSEDQKRDDSLQQHSASILGEVIIENMYGSSGSIHDEETEPVVKIEDGKISEGNDQVSMSPSVLPMGEYNISENNNTESQSSAYLFSDSERATAVPPAGVLKTRRLESTGKLLNHNRAELIRKHLPLGIQVANKSKVLHHSTTIKYCYRSSIKYLYLK